MGNIVSFNPMMGERSFNGTRLRTARMWRDLSATQLSEMTGISRQTISMLENGKIASPEFNTVYKLSEELNFPVNYFLEEENVKFEHSATYFRSLLTTNKKYRREQEEKIKFIATVYTMLSEYLEFERLNLPVIPYGTSPQNAAKMLRDYWGLGNKPIENIVYIAENNGLILTEFESVTADVDAFSRKIKTGDIETYLIGFSKNKRTAARIHFDVAHEIGHILLHGCCEDLESMDKDEFKEIELQAHAFASAFLLPAEEFIKDVSLYATNLAYYVELKKKWKVSIAAMIRRSKDLQIITAEEYSRLMRNMQKQGIRKVEPLDEELITAEPSLLKTAIKILIDQNVFSPNEFLEELSQNFGLTLYPSDMETLLGLPKGTFLQHGSEPKIVISLKSEKERGSE